MRRSYLSLGAGDFLSLGDGELLGRLAAADTFRGMWLTVVRERRRTSAFSCLRI